MAQAQILRAGRVIRNAILFDPKRRWSHVGNDSISAVDRLFALLAARGIDYLLVGGVALLSYVESRNTEDLDLVISPEALGRLPGLTILSRANHFATALFEGVSVNLNLASNPLFDRIRRLYATTRPFAEREIPCATPEGLFLLKLYALPSLYRQGRMPRAALYEADLLALLVAFPLPKEALLEELAPFVPASDFAELTKLVGEISERIKGHRFG